MGTLLESFKLGTGFSTGYKLIDHFSGPSQDAKLQSKDRQLDREFQRKNVEAMAAANREHQNKLLSAQSYENYAQREFSEKQNEKERRNRREIQASINESNERIAEIDSETRRYEADRARETAEAACRAQYEIAAADLNLRDRHHHERLCHESDLVDRQIATQENIARQTHELERYLTERKICSDKEIARFKMLAARETQILVARENAANTMRDHFVQEAIRHFPLNISPIVLLRNRPHSLDRLLAFSQDSQSGVSVSEVYEEVSSYTLNPEALNIFIAPVQIDSKIHHKDALREQLWDTVCSDVESFFNTYFNRNSNSSVIVYPKAWKENMESGTHASETLYYFLRDMPCFVLEPRFDGQRFCLTISAWGLGYESTEHIRSEIIFDLNIDVLLVKAAYARSKKALHLIESLDSAIDERLEDKIKQLKQNITLFESIDIDNCNAEVLSELNAIGIYELFHIEPVQDLAVIAEQITQHINIVLAILADIHHLLSTDADIKFPEIFKDRFPALFEDKEFRERVFRWYERVYIRLRNKDKRHLTVKQQQEVANIRENQIRNLAYTLALIDESSLSSEIDKAITNYAKQHHGFSSDSIDDIWWKCIDAMTVEEIEFFERLKEQLPRTDKRRRRIVNRISELRYS